MNLRALRRRAPLVLLVALAWGSSTPARAAQPEWASLSPTGGPVSHRSGYSAVYDAPRSRMVIYGGFNGAYKNDVWALSLTSPPAWTEITPVLAGPAARAVDFGVAQSLPFGAR